LQKVTPSFGAVVESAFTKDVALDVIAATARRRRDSSLGDDVRRQWQQASGAGGGLGLVDRQPS
jgi:hypothetical protein